MADLILDKAVAWLERNSHGHCYTPKSGLVARCGGPGICPKCAKETQLISAMRAYEKTLVDPGCALAFAVARMAQAYDERIVDMARAIVASADAAVKLFSELVADLEFEESHGNPQG